MTKFIAACVQTNATDDVEENLRRIEPMLREAAARGAQFIALPENADCMFSCSEKRLAHPLTEAAHPAIPFFARMAKETKAWILVGSLAIAGEHERFANRCYLFNPQGEIVVRYDKIHMFDAVLSEKEKYKESESFRSGDRAVLAETPWGKVGLTICYDVRFPHLHRALAKAGARIITAPAAFAKTTGEMHWHVLQRARAIETGCFIIAPAQCGTHDGGRQTYGHSLIIDPTGKILAEAGGDVGVITAEIDTDLVEATRKRLPSLYHDCEFERP